MDRPPQVLSVSPAAAAQGVQLADLGSTAVVHLIGAQLTVCGGAGVVVTPSSNVTIAWSTALPKMIGLSGLAAVWGYLFVNPGRNRREWQSRVVRCPPAHFIFSR